MELSIKEQKQIKRKDYILNGNLWKVAASIVLPIALYNLCNYLYGIYDMILVQSANIGEAADVVVLDQIKNMISTIGSAIAGACGILVSRKLGAGNIEDAKKTANTAISLAIVVSLVTILFIPFGTPFLKLFNTDQSIIDNSIGYYNVQILTLIITTLNVTMLAIEKSKGKTIHLLYLNLVVVIIKITLTTLFAYGPFENVTSTWLATATLISQLFMFISCLYLSLKKENILKISIKSLNFNKELTFTLIKLAFPLFLNYFLPNFGKVYINSLATKTYGKMCVGALGISNTIAGMFGNIVNSSADGTSTIISQNYGAKNINRIKITYNVQFIYVTIISIIGTMILFFLRRPIASFFAPNDLNYQEMIVNIFSWECFDILFLGFSAVSTALFNGTGRVKVNLLISMSRLFIIRIPFLLVLIYLVKMDYTACGIIMFTSNTIAGIVHITWATIYKNKLKCKIN